MPVIASGGAGSLEHLCEGLVEGQADAVLAASIFHFGIHTIAEAKAVPAPARRGGEGGAVTDDELRFDDHGLIPAVVQEADTGEVLMVAWMDRPALEKTLATGITHFWSRSRQAPWQKGETSGHTQHVQWHLRRLRRRHPAGAGPPERGGLSHRQPHLFLHGGSG